MSESRLVYSTDGGDRRKDAPEERSAAPAPGDGVVRVSREQTGRRGKTVTVVRGLQPGEVEATAKELKRQCGTGGTAKDGVVELQGDHREKAAALLRAGGHTVKLAGG